MINPDEFKAAALRIDHTFGMVVLLALFVCVIIASLWRWNRFRDAVQRLASLDPTRLIGWIKLSHLLILAAVLRIPRMFDSFWYDEAFTARLVGLPPAGMREAIMQDVHPPLWYIVDGVSGRLFGMNEIGLRLPSFVLGIVLVWLTYRLGLNMFVGLKFRAISESVDKEVIAESEFYNHLYKLKSLHAPLQNVPALVAAGLIAIFPAAIYYSNEARVYMLMACLIFGALIAIFEDRPIWFAATAGLIPLSHNLGWFYLVVLIVGTIWYWSGKWYATLIWVLSGITAIVFAGQWIPALAQQMSYVSDGYWVQPFSLGGGLWLLLDGTVRRQLLDPFIIPAVIGLVGLVGLAIPFTLVKFTSDRARWLMLFAVMIGVPVGVGVISAVWNPIYVTRALLPAALLVVFPLAFLLTNAKHRALLRVVVAAVIGMGLISFYSPRGAREDVRGMAAAECAGVDFVYATSIPAAMFASAYVDAPLYTWENAADLGYTLTSGSKEAFAFESLDIAQARGRGCVLTLETPTTSPDELARIASIRAAYGVGGHEYEINSVYHVQFLRVEVNNG